MIPHTYRPTPPPKTSPLTYAITSTYNEINPKPHQHLAHPPLRPNLLPSAPAHHPPSQQITHIYQIPNTIINPHPIYNLDKKKKGGGGGTRIDLSISTSAFRVFTPVCCCSAGGRSTNSFGKRGHHICIVFGKRIFQRVVRRAAGALSRGVEA